MKKLIIIDDHLLVREGMRSLLESTGNYRIIADFPDGTSFLEREEETVADLILLDISMPGKSGLEILREIRRNNEAVPIIIVSMYTERDFAVKSIQAGANGYISKNSVRDEILNAVETVLKGGIYLSEYSRRNLHRRLSNEVAGLGEPDYGKDLLSELSEQEYEVVLRLCKGRTIKEIAYDLDISNKTVSTYKKRIMEKMEFESLTDLIKFGIEQGLVV